MRGIALKFALLLNIANADYTGKLPNTITLQGGTSQSHNAIASCTAWDCTFGYINGGGGYDFTYSTNGNADSTLTLNATLPQNPPAGAQKTIKFYIGNATLNPHSNLILNNFESALLQSSLNLNNATMKFNATSATSTFQIQENASVTLNNNATLEIKSNNFTNYNELSLHNSTLSITAQEIFSYKQIQNNNGTITVNGNFYNVGQKSALGGANPSSIAILTNNGGNITIKGSFYNGWQKDANLDCRISVCGGGILINNGGTINIQGQLISERKDGQNSSINIYGGTLTATGGVQNLAGSTLTIGALNDKMGKIVGDLTNNGAYIIDAAGAGGCGQDLCSYELITGGGSTGLDSAILRNGNSDFASASLTNGNKTLTITINQSKITHFKSMLNSNESATLERFGESIYTISGASVANLKSAANDINRAIFSAFYATPLAILDNLGANLTPKPRKKSTQNAITKRIKNTKNPRTIRRIAANPNDINAGFIVQGIASGASGILGGVRAGYGRDFASGRFALNFAYAYGSLKNAVNSLIATQNLATKSHNLALGANLNARIAGDFGVDLGLSGFMIFANHTREIKAPSALHLNSSLKSRQNIYQIALDSAFVYDFKVRNFMISPFIGLNQGFLAMPSFAESSGAFALNAKAYNSYFLNTILGAKMSFDFGTYGAILGKINYKYLAYNSQKTRILRYTNATQDDLLRFKIPNAHKISFDLGYQKDFGSWYLRVSGNFGAFINASKAKDTSVNFYDYGINGVFGYRF